jgi:hypothetical protein
LAIPSAWRELRFRAGVVFLLLDFGTTGVLRLREPGSVDSSGLGATVSVSSLLVEVAAVFVFRGTCDEFNRAREFASTFR